jgi:cytochrome c oxidase cbb3-type subunit 3
MRMADRMGAAIAACFATITVIASGVAIAPSRAQQKPSSDSAAIERGRKQFGESCGFCHGADATGARGPDLVRSELVAHDVKGDKIGDVILHGRPDKGMPPQTLTEQQVSDIAAFLHARMIESIESSGVPSAYPIEKLLTGNAGAGKAFFNGAGGCNGCHSPTGDLAGVAKKYSSIELESRMLYPEGPPPKCTVTLPTGERLNGTVKHIDEFTVVTKDDSGWLRAFSRGQVKVELHDPLAAHRQLLETITPTQFHDLFAFIASLK